MELTWSGSITIEHERDGDDASFEVKVAVTFEPTAEVVIEKFALALFGGIETVAGACTLAEELASDTIAPFAEVAELNIMMPVAVSPPADSG